MSNIVERIKRLLRLAGTSAEEAAEGGTPVATPPSGARGDPDRETSTNAQTAGAADEPWGDNE